MEGGYFGNIVMGDGGRVYPAPPIPIGVPVVDASGVNGEARVGVGVGVGLGGFVGVIPEGTDQPVTTLPASLVNGSLVVDKSHAVDTGAPVPVVGDGIKSAMKKRHLDSHGDECEGFGGELGRRLGELVLQQGEDPGDSSGGSSPFIGSPPAVGVKIGRRRVLTFEDDEDVDGGGHTDGVGGMKSFREFSTTEVGVGA